MLGNQDKGHDELIAFGVRMTDQSFIAMVCERKFTVYQEVFSIKSRRVFDSMLIYQYELCRSCSSP